MLLIRKPWDSQPQESVGVDWGNPLAQGIAFWTDATGSASRPPSVNGTRQNATSRGILRGFGTTSGVASTDMVTSAETVTANASGASFLFIASYNGGGTSPRIFSHNEVHLLVAGSSQNISFSLSGGTPFWTYPAVPSTPAVDVCTYAGGTTDPRLWRDGVAQTITYGSGTRSGTLTTTGAVMRVGNRPGNDRVHEGNIGLFVWWNRVLSDSEAQALSANPWQLFAPRSIWVPVSAAGGGYTLTASPGAYTLSGQSATITRSRALTASPGSYALSGQAATITRNRALVASSGAYTLSGQAATITRNRALTASSGAYTLSGQAATITYTPGSGTTYTLTASAGAYTLSGQVASLLYGRLLVAGSGSYAVTGQDATITYTPAALPTVGRPASDASNAGWTASTGSDLYAMLDEVTPDSADYIVTTSTGSICEMPLQTTAYPGTAAQKLSYRASSSTGNSVIVRLKNTGGATVRTETQILTATDTLYEITLTSGEIAAITSGALSVQLESA